MASVASSISGMSSAHSTSGSTDPRDNSGRSASPGSGVRTTGGSPSSATVANAVGAQPRQAPRQKPPPGPPQPHIPGPGQTRLPSAQNAPLGTPAMAPPHPGLIPPYPDARSPQPTLQTNGLPIMPAPVGFIGPGMMTRVPATFAPGMTGLLGR